MSLAGALWPGVVPVLAGGAYLVGERGPELFPPSRSGAIIPNHKLGGPGIATIIPSLSQTVRWVVQDSAAFGSASPRPASRSA